MSEVSVGRHKYRIEPLSVFDQFDIARRVAPVLSLMTTQKDREKLKEGFARAFVTLSSGLSREDGQTILAICLGKVSRRDTVGFAPVQSAGQIMYSDIDMQQMLELVWHVLAQSKVIDFFDVPVSDLKEPVAGAPSA